MAGLIGGLLLGFLGDPNMIQQGCGTLHVDRARSLGHAGVRHAAGFKTCTPFSVNGLIAHGSSHQLWEQMRAAVWSSSGRRSSPSSS